MIDQLEHIKPIINRVMEQIKEKTKRVELFGNSEQLKGRRYHGRRN